jgi:hypothetical protein
MLITKKMAMGKAYCNSTHYESIEGNSTFPVARAEEDVPLQRGVLREQVVCFACD